ncbi:MAG: hypothetical protein FWG50_10515 [Kiritimatiellaeota bacterium]|nr:hypothetical protein [Kiritimatiellota bacterium]
MLGTTAGSFGNDGAFASARLTTYGEDNSPCLSSFLGSSKTHFVVVFQPGWMYDIPELENEREDDDNE